jgi:hypothetical protein
MSIPRLFLIIAFCSLLLVGIAVGRYTPDIFVFVHYAYTDNSSRSVSIDSLFSNNVIFDFLIVIGDFLQINSPIGWHQLIVTVVLLVSFLKYYLLASYGMRLNGLLLLFLSSFFIDINQLRFSLATVLLMSLWSIKSRYFSKLVKLLSLLAHLLPLSIVLFARLYSRQKYGFVIVTSSLAFIAASFYQQLTSYSRLFFYASPTLFYFPKILLAAIPVILYLRSSKRYIEDINYKGLAAISGMLLTSSIIFLPINVNLSARFIEYSYMLANLTNGFFKVSNRFDLLLCSVSLLILLSRLINGIDGFGYHTFYT